MQRYFIAVSHLVCTSKEECSALSKCNVIRNGFYRHAACSALVAIYTNVMTSSTALDSIAGFVFAFYVVHLDKTPHSVRISSYVILARIFCVVIATPFDSIFPF